MKKHVLMFLVLIPLQSFSRVGVSLKQLSFYYGNSIRFNNLYFNSFDIYNERFYRGCLGQNYNGFGIGFLDLRNNDYGLNLKFFHSINLIPSSFLISYVGVAPVFYNINNQNILNFKPEVGIRFNSSAYFRKPLLSASFIISYGYDISLFNADKFTINRNDLNVKIGLSINLNNLKRKKESSQNQLIVP